MFVKFYVLHSYVCDGCDIYLYVCVCVYVQQNESEKAAEAKVKEEFAEKLQTALDRQEIPYLRSLLVQAKGMGLGTDSKHAAVLKHCDDAVEKMKQKQELEIALNSAVRSKNVDKISECIAKVEASGISVKLDSAIKMKNSLIDQESIAEKLGVALAKNDVTVLTRYVCVQLVYVCLLALWLTFVNIYVYFYLFNYYLIFVYCCTFTCDV